MAGVGLRKEKLAWIFSDGGGMGGGGTGARAVHWAGALFGTCIRSGRLDRKVSGLSPPLPRDYSLQNIICKHSKCSGRTTREYLVVDKKFNQLRLQMLDI